jgi:hypothetical protein
LPEVTGSPGYKTVHPTIIGDAPANNSIIQNKIGTLAAPLILATVDTNTKTTIEQITINDVMPNPLQNHVLST